MATRLFIATGFALAIAAAPAIAVVAGAQRTPVDPIAACTPGEEMDVFTTVCTPFLVPNSPSGLTSIPGNPDIPAIDGIPCAGASSGACIGLAEEQQAQEPQPVPRSIISSSP